MTITHVDFDPDKKRIEDIFEGSLQLVIPRYQRTYSWNKDKVEEFFDDFIEESPKAEDNLAFLGTIIFSKAQTGELEVIDGQQRLVTITIFFAALRDLLLDVVKTHDAITPAAQIQNKITISSSFGSSYMASEKNLYKLRVGVEIESIFSQIIYERPKKGLKTKTHNSAERRVQEAYSYFFNRIKEKIEHASSSDQLKLLNRFLVKINSIDYIDIRVTNDEVAYNLFESHNAKGVALAKTDLIKNYYFGRLGGSETQKDKKMDEWDSLFQDLDKSTSGMYPDRFFNYMVQSYEGNFTSSLLYKRIKPYMNNPDAFMKRLRKNIESMIELKSSNTGIKAIDRSLSVINEQLKVNQCFILLVCLHRNKLKLHRSQYERIVLLIENFSYLYSAVSKLPTNTLERLYSRLASYAQKEFEKMDSNSSDIDKQRISGKIYSNLRKEFIELKPAFGTFFEGFSDLTYDKASNKPVIRYTFEKMEYYFSEGMVELGASFTLDHILPQKDFKGRGKLYQTIGNLVPLSAPGNSAKGSRLPESGMYQQNANFYSSSMVAEMLKENKAFNEERINDRLIQLAEYMYNEACYI